MLSSVQLVDKVKNFFSSIPMDLVSTCFVCAFFFFRFTSPFKKGFFYSLADIIGIAIASVCTLLGTLYLFSAITSLGNFALKQYHVWAFMTTLLLIMNLIFSALMRSVIGNKKFLPLDIMTGALVVFFEMFLLLSAFNYTAEHIYKNSHNSDLYQWISSSENFPEHIKRYCDRKEGKQISEAPKITSLFSALSVFVLEYQHKIAEFCLRSDSSVNLRIKIARLIIWYTSNLDNAFKRGNTSKNIPNLKISPGDLQLLLQIPDKYTTSLTNYAAHFNGKDSYNTNSYNTTITDDEYNLDQSNNAGNAK